MQYIVKPIGVVKNNIKEPMRRGWDMVTSELILHDNLEESTEGLEEFSHIIVVFWMHKVPLERDIPAKVHPRGRQDLPLVGLFATRAPYRHNPIGISIVRLLERKRNVLKVEGLDAINSTPVIDIKPYLPKDNITDVTFPKWVAKL